MARNNKLGEIRRSQVLGYGPGAIIDFRAGDGAISVLAPGLEFWDEYAKPPFPNNPQVIREPRLQKKLKVKGFRLPPVDIDKGKYNKNKDKSRVALPGFRFPQWLQCPSCSTLKFASKWGREEGDPARWCNPCSTGKGRKVFVVPTRFVVACPKGHLDEFPWSYWLKMIPENRATCKGDRYCTYKLKSKGGTGLSSLYIVCAYEDCDAIRSMGDIFSSGALKGYRCNGKMPWLKADREECDEDPRVLQRGASNLYFPVEVSALSIPPWSDAFQEALEVHWQTLTEIDEADLSSAVRMLLSVAAESFEMTVEDICSEIVRRKKYLKSPEREDLKYDELNSFTGESLFKYTQSFDDTDFKTTNQKVPHELSRFITRIIRVDRLKEIRALKTFTRINQAASSYESGKSNFGKISSNPGIKWLPAIEVKGEGLFFCLNDRLLDKWSEQEEIQTRVTQIDSAHKKEWEKFVGDDVERPFKITAKFLLLHTLSHIIMRNISLECGYETASIRERIYCNEGESSNNGILLYTASSDAEGTLGGLARMSESDKFFSLIKSAIQKASWCSSDPLCIKGISSESETFNLSACHNCVLIPETSCEFFNRFLDRSLLIGSPDSKLTGFFQEFPKQ